MKLALFDIALETFTLMDKRMRPKKAFGVIVALVGWTLLSGCGPQMVQGKTVPAEADEAPAAGLDESSATSTNGPVVLLTPRIPPPHLKLPEGVEAIIKLAESGVEDSVLLAYIANSPSSFDLSADDILYLNDVGISSTVVSAMLNHSNKPAPDQPSASIVASQPAAITPPISVAIPPANPYPKFATAPLVPDGVDPNFAPVAPPLQETYNYFYTSLQPYGDWVEVPEYGLCWQPTAAVLQPEWRPYCDRGHWLYSDYGWYWHSDYSWGWAPFHYGRWHHASHHGWVWIPDTTWGASWVSWRQSDGYCGWAPLPPAAVFRPGIGFTFHDAHVGVSFGFGLGYDRYTFVPTRHFYDRNPRIHATAAAQTFNIYKGSTVVNNYVQGNNHTIINEGMGREHIAAATHQEIHKVAIRDVPSSSAVNVRPERLDRSGSTPVIYRPPPPPIKTQAAEVVRVQQEQPRVASAIAVSRPPPAAASRPLVSAQNNEGRLREEPRIPQAPAPLRQEVRSAPVPQPAPQPVYRNPEPSRQPVPQPQYTPPEYPRQEIRGPASVAPSPAYNSRPFLTPGPSMVPSTIPHAGGLAAPIASPSVPSVQRPAPPPPVQHSQPQQAPAPKPTNKEEQRR